MKNLFIGNICPACGSILKIVRLQCKNCSTTIEGEFSTPLLARLNSEQQRFVQVFIKARGSIKEVEKELGVSYPTVCKKLDEIGKILGYAPENVEKREKEILEAIEKGKISAEQGANLLKEL
ncbi:MAG: DUF2089 domain-containing protein [Nitrospirae bacterium]|nr:DUF2089 domain-containing protein [Nitrospirota bacterium]